MAKGILVRPATVSDARGIADVHVAAWRGAYEAIVPAEVLAGQSVARRQSWWEEVLAPDADRGLGVDVALVDDVIAGFCAVGLSRDDDAALGVGELHALYVHPSQWGRGTGSALLNHGEQCLSSDFRLVQATLWVLEANTSTRAWYERRGWKTDGGWRDEQRGSLHLRELRYRKNLPRVRSGPG